MRHVEAKQQWRKETEARPGASHKEAHTRGEASIGSCPPAAVISGLTLIENKAVLPLPVGDNRALTALRYDSFGVSRPASAGRGSVRRTTQPEGT